MIAIPSFWSRSVICYGWTTTAVTRRHQESLTSTVALSADLVHGIVYCEIECYGSIGGCLPKSSYSLHDTPCNAIAISKVDFGNGLVRIEIGQLDSHV